MNQPELRVGAAQINPKLADVNANIDQHLAIMAQAGDLKLDLLVFPELSLTGYALQHRVSDVACTAKSENLLLLAKAAGSMQVVVGFVEYLAPGEYCNALAILQQGEVQAVHRKLNLPTYGGLEEGKWFAPGRDLTQSNIANGWKASHLICADLWNPGLVHATMLTRPHLLCTPINSASGIVSADFSNEQNWATNLAFYAMTYGVPIVMANRCGPEGNHHFWGGSRILGPRGEILAMAAEQDTLITATLSQHDIARARLDAPTMRQADTALVKKLLDQGR